MLFILCENSYKFLSDFQTPIYNIIFFLILLLKNFYNKFKLNIYFKILNLLFFFPIIGFVKHLSME